MLLGLAVAAFYGAADFLGGLCSKRSVVAAVVVLSQLCSLPLLAVLVVVAGGQPTGRALLFGAAAGAFGGVGLACLYRGLASGRMSIVAPITAVGAAAVPVLWGLLGGERPSAAALVGVAVAMVAVAFVSRASGDPVEADEAPQGPARPAGRGARGSGGRTAANPVALAVVAGGAFGSVFVLLAETGPGVGFWPLVAARLTSIVLLATGAVATGRSLAPAGPGALALIAVTGFLDLAANAVYLLATRRGLLAVVAVLGSLYPAGTVLLARVVLGERLAGLQVFGLVLALAGVVMIAAG